MSRFNRSGIKVGSLVAFPNVYDPTQPDDGPRGIVLDKIGPNVYEGASYLVYFAHEDERWLPERSLLSLTPEDERGDAHGEGDHSDLSS